MSDNIKDIEIVPVIESIIEFLEDYPETNVSKVCETFGITYYIFNKNLKKLPDLRLRYNDFKGNRDTCLAEKGKVAFVKMAEGYPYEEVKTTYDPEGKIKERVVFEKIKHPDYKSACIISGTKPDADVVEQKEVEDKTVKTKRLSNEDWQKKHKEDNMPKNIKPMKFEDK